MDGNKIIPNRTPILPNSEVRLCDDEILNNIYLTPDGLNIGHLLTRDNVRVYLDTNKLVSRHFAILSITEGKIKYRICFVQRTCKEKWNCNNDRPPWRVYLFIS